jgi:hypothetical protein
MGAFRVVEKLYRKSKFRLFEKIVAIMPLRRSSWWQMMAYVYAMYRLNHREHRGTEENGKCICGLPVVALVY